MSQLLAASSHFQLVNSTIRKEATTENKVKSFLMGVEHGKAMNMSRADAQKHIDAMK